MRSKVFQELGKKWAPTNTTVGYQKVSLKINPKCPDSETLILMRSQKSISKEWHEYKHH